MSDTPDTDHPFAYRRTPNGVYASCFEKFSGDPDSLSQLHYPADFTVEADPWADNPDNFTSHFTRAGHDSSNDLSITLFGEVLGEREGTALGAKGNKRTSVTSMFSFMCVKLLTHRLVCNNLGFEGSGQDLIRNTDLRHRRYRRPLL